MIDNSFTIGEVEQTLREMMKDAYEKKDKIIQIIDAYIQAINKDKLMARCEGGYLIDYKIVYIQQVKPENLKGDEHIYKLFFDIKLRKYKKRKLKCLLILLFNKIKKFFNF